MASAYCPVPQPMSSTRESLLNILCFCSSRKKWSSSKVGNLCPPKLSAMEFHISTLACLFLFFRDHFPKISSTVIQTLLTKARETKNHESRCLHASTPSWLFLSHIQLLAKIRSHSGHYPK